MTSEQSEKNLLLIFTKNPVAGKVKTRLAKDVGDEKALEIYQFLLDHSVKFTSKVVATRQVWYSDEINNSDIWDNDLFQKKEQLSSPDLGERMQHAFENGFSEGFERILIIGTDLYDISEEDIRLAFESLDNHDFVIGPATDGGYYLLGMKSLNSEIFKNKNWGTNTVLENTLQDLQEYQLKLMEPRNDVDYLDDIRDHPAFQKFIEL